MAGKHTPGKIAVTYWSKRESALTTADGKTHFCGPGLPGDMERLAALWNACEGIPNPSAIREVVEALKDARTTIVITRGNIMSEIARCRDESESPWAGVPEQLRKRLDIIDAALAKLEGRSND